MNRFNSLRRLLKSLFEASYPSQDTINIQIRFDRPIQFEQNNNDTNNNSTITNNNNINNTADNNNNSNKNNNNNEYKNWLYEIQLIEKLINGKWLYGNTNIFISDVNLGLQQSWFTSWVPKTKYDRALILEDDLQLSSIYYIWLKDAHNNYGYGQYQTSSTTSSTSSNTNEDASNNNSNSNSNSTISIKNKPLKSSGYRSGPKINDLASICLPRQTLVPSKKEYKKTKLNVNGIGIFPSDQPFMYSLLGSHGFSPLAHIWMEFLGKYST
jgi:hypothetical protein